MQQLEPWYFFLSSTEKDSERCFKDALPVVVGLPLTKWYFIFAFLDRYNEFNNVWCIFTSNFALKTMNSWSDSKIQMRENSYTSKTIYLFLKK